MGALVQYRDLPGGPTELRLCDELSRHCMCSSCGMLSMSMMQDTNKHMFCETCLRERSDKYGSEHIYCKYENQEVSIFEMFQANDLITVIRDQYVFCPNPECKEPVTLEDLKEHYIQCKPTVTCQTCHRQVQTADWSDHIEICNKQEACKSPSTEAIPKQPRSNDALSLPKQSPPPKMDSIQNSRQTSTSLYLSRELQQTQHLLQNPGNESQENTKPCPYCQRKVKERNLELHMTKCPQAPQSCVYCEEKIIKTELNHHVQMCKKNPDNCPKPEPGKPKRVSKETGAQSPFAHGEKKASEKAKNSTSNGAKQHSKGTPPNPTAKYSTPRAKGASNSCPGPEKGVVPPDTPVWLEYLSSGNYLAAFAAFEESFSGKEMSEHQMYGEFTTRFVETKCYEMVKDLLEKASPTNPLDCLMAALLARVFLPPQVWTKSTEKVTWNDAFKYLPSVLVSRLQNKKVMEYLENYPVFLQRPGASNAFKASPSAQDQPPTASNSSNSAQQAAPANDVADVVTKANDGTGASGAIKGNRSGRGGPTGENRPHLHAEKRTSEQSLVKGEVENCNDDKHQASKKRRKNNAKARSRNRDALSHRSISSTQQAPISDQLKPGTSKADLPSNLSHLDEEPSSKERSMVLHPTSASASFKCEPVGDEKNLEESSSCVAVEGHSVTEAISPGCQTSISDRTPFPCLMDDHFSDTADAKGTAHKVENASILNDAVLDKHGESLTQSDNYHTPSMTCEASELLNVRNTDSNTATEGSTQADDFSNGSNVVSLPEQALPAQENDSNGCEAAHTKDEAIQKHEDQRLTMLQSSVSPEQDPSSLKHETRRSEEPLQGGPGKCDFSVTATHAETFSEAEHSNASVGNSALKEDEDTLLEYLQCQEDNTANALLEQCEALARRLADISIPASGSTMQADPLFHTAPVVPTSVQENNTAECKTYPTKKEPLVGPALETTCGPPWSTVYRSAPVTGTVRPQSPNFLAFTTRFGFGTLRREFRTAMPRFSHPNKELRAGCTNSAAKEQTSSSTKSEQQRLGRTTPCKNQHDGSNLSRPSSSFESADERTSQAPASSHHNTTSSQVGKEALCVDRYPVDGPTESSSSSESL